MAKAVRRGATQRWTPHFDEGKISNFVNLLLISSSVGSSIIEYQEALACSHACMYMYVCVCVWCSREHKCYCYAKRLLINFTL